MRVRYSPFAAIELSEILDYIAERSPAGAKRVLARIDDVERILAQFPGLGSPTRDPALRAMLVSPFPYVLLYEERDHEIVVHRVRHTSRKR